jgi:chaperonin cofactor prefoldin
MREKSKGLSGEEKVKADKEIDELSKKHESLESKIKDPEEAGEDKFEDLKKSIAGAIEEHSPGTGK